MTHLHPDLLGALAAASIRSPRQYELLGELHDVGDEAGLLPALADDLYRQLYTRPTPPPRARARDESARRDFALALSAANCGSGGWEGGWRVVRAECDGTVAVARDDVTFWVGPAHLRVAAGDPRPGVACRVKVAKELRHLVPGDYVALGDAGTGDDDAGGPDGVLVRAYWHLTSAAAVPFVREATRLLNRLGVPFRAKVLNDPAAYLRADAGVLYVRRGDHDRLGDALDRLHDAVAPGLRPEVPLFTRRRAPGLGLAEGRGDRESFGQHRCRLVARALWRSYASGEVGTAARAATAAAVFREEGLDPLRPDLDPGPPDPAGTRRTSTPVDAAGEPC